MATESLATESSGLAKTTNWWGAFVIGLAGTILVTGIAPFAVQGMGAAAIFWIGLNTLFGLILCLCLAEMAVMWPDRHGGVPSYAQESFTPALGQRRAHWLGGFAGWSYWLGWFPVAPINMILAANYIAALFTLNTDTKFNIFSSVGGSPIPLTVLIISIIGIVGMYIPAHFGLNLGARFATILGILSMLPLTALIFLPFFKPGSMNWSNIAGFSLPEGVTGSPAFYLGWVFPITWSVIAMEAAACYVGECREPARDAKIAMTAEGIYGAFIYIMTPLVFVGVLGAADSFDPLTLYTEFTAKLFGDAPWVQWVIGIPLILALILSVLNAIMGCGRSLWQASEDRALPEWFGKVNSHGVPDRAMLFNVVCSIIVLFFGSPLAIYIFSNAGYLFACSLALLGYFVYRHMRPDTPRPYRLPTFMKWVALAIFLFWAVVWTYGGWNAPDIVVAAGSGPTLFLIGIAIMLIYIPLHMIRRASDRKKGIDTEMTPAL